MASPRVRRLVKQHRMSLQKQPEEVIQEVVVEKKSELEKVKEEIPEEIKLVELEVEIGEDEPVKVDEKLLEELLKKEE